MTLVESITKDIRELPTSKLVEVARFVREIAPELADAAAVRQREALTALHGCMDEETGEVFEAALAGSSEIEER